jgi:hypothetical protein
MIIYCAYPILNQTEEPVWMNILKYAVGNKLITNTSVYSSFTSLTEQESLHSIIGDINYKSTEKGDIYSLLDSLNISDIYVPTSLEEVLALDDSQGNSLKIVTKDLWVLTKANLLIVDCDTPSYGEKDMLLTVANLIGIPTIGVSNNFIISPWSAQLTSYRCKTNELPGMVNMISKSLYSKTEEKC